MPSRKIAQAIEIMLTIIHYCKTKKTSLALLSLEACKAFDRLEWSFWEQQLMEINIGIAFTQVI